MKKFYILLIALFVVNCASGQGSIPASSIDASAQSKHPALNLQHRTLNSMDDVQVMMGNRESKTSDFYAEKKSKEPINNRTPHQRLLIQIYDSIYHWNWDTISLEWHINQKITDIVYDANNNLTSETYQNWNGSGWENYERNTYTYDANNNQTSYIGQDWNGNAWENSLQYIITYDANNNHTSWLYQRWNGSGWENYKKYTYTFDANNNDASWLYQIWNGTAWENSWLNTFTYDANNNRTNELFQEWNSTAWVNSSLCTYTFDANNYLTSQLYQNWNGSAWETYGQTFWTYDASNNLINRLYQEWNGTAWVNSMQYPCTYDTNNNEISDLVQYWNGTAWVNSSLQTSTYDANNFRISNSTKSWNSAGVIEYADSTRYYFHTVLGVNDLKVPSESFTVYPNPTSTQITIETPTTPYKNTFLTIYNIRSQQLITRQITEPKTLVDISNLPSGVYFVRLTNDRTVQTGKFVKL